MSGEDERELGGPTVRLGSSNDHERLFPVRAGMRGSRGAGHRRGISENALHETNRADAKSIMRFGFRDEGTVLMPGGPASRCVFVADKPIRKRDAHDPATIAISADHLSEDELHMWERTQRANGYREPHRRRFVTPAGVSRFRTLWGLFVNE
jgi:hypothetical protein